jgi:hypothetical protein
MLRPARFAATVTLIVGLWCIAGRADDAGRVALFDLRPISSNGQTDLALLREAVKLSADLRVELGKTGANVVSLDDLKAVLGPIYRVNAFDCREVPACLQRTMIKLGKHGIRRVVIGTYEAVGSRAQLTLHAIDTSSGAFTKVELFEAQRGGALDSEDAARVMASLAGVSATSEPTAGSASNAGSSADLGSGDQTDELAPMPPPPPPPVPDRIQVLGWLRSETAYFLEHQGSDVIAAPYDTVESRNQLYLSARYQRSNRFEAAASGLLEFDVFDKRTAFDPSLRELYIGAYWTHFGLRIGNQRIAWGKGDAISPNDVINPRDLRDPLLTDPELRRIPTFAIRADYEMGSHALQIVFQPFFTPDLYDVDGTNWSVIQPESPDAVRGMFRLISGLFDPSLFDRTQQLFAQTSLPTRPSVGGRYSYTGHNLDASLYYQFGYDSTPRVTVDPTFAQQAAMIDWRTATPSTLAPILNLLDMGLSPYTATFQRRHHLGADGVTTFGPIAVKLDAAYETASVFYQPDLESFVSPQLQGVVSVEYQTGELGKLIVVEGIVTHVVDPLPTIGLIGYKRDSAGGALTARWTFFNIIEAELRAVYEAVPRAVVLQPQLAYRSKSNGLTIAIGALYLSGDDESFGDYYSRNKSAYVTVKLPY